MSNIIDGSNRAAEWLSWKTQFGRSYSSHIEECRRYQIWCDNDDFIKKHNAEFYCQLQTFCVAHNESSDLSQNEFNLKYKGYAPPCEPCDPEISIIEYSCDPCGPTYDIIRADELPIYNKYKQLEVSKLYEDYYAYQKYLKIPGHIDWRKCGAVNPVRNQEPCGSCFAFGTLGAVEAQNFFKTGLLVKLSEQDIVDNSGMYGNIGCGGGYPEAVIDYIEENGGVATEADYPYRNDKSCCKKSCRAAKFPIECYGSIKLPYGNEYALAYSIAAIGPITVAFDSSPRSFRFYKSGLYNDPIANENDPDHIVLAVGYGSDGPGRDYYIVKNSWGTNWGECGYVKIHRNAGNFGGIASEASFPIISDHAKREALAYGNITRKSSVREKPFFGLNTRSLPSSRIPFTGVNSRGLSSYRSPFTGTNSRGLTSYRSPFTGTNSRGLGSYRSPFTGTNSRNLGSFR